MVMNRVRFHTLIAGLAALALAQGALAAAKPAPTQQAAPGQPPQPSDTKVFGDWTVRCYNVASPSPCEMIEVRVAKKTGQRVLAVLMAYVPSRDATVMQIGVPLGVALQNGLVLASDTFTSPVLHFSRCDPQGCYVQTAIDNASLGALEKATKAETQIVFVDGHKLALPISLDGFSQARGALVDLAKSKATKPTADAAVPPADASAAQPAQ
jgi:invasion protein IalB